MRLLMFKLLSLVQQYCCQIADYNGKLNIVHTTAYNGSFIMEKCHFYLFSHLHITVG